MTVASQAASSATHSPAPSPAQRKHRNRKVATATSPPPIPAQVDGRGIYGIGDSIMVDATADLRSAITGMQINAEVGRAVEPGVSILQDLAAHGSVAATTVFGLGTNGPFLSSQLAELVRLTAGHRLIVVTTHCPYCSWTDANNAMVRAECTAARHCFIAHFQAHARKHPEWFFSDGVHLPSVGVGARAYARLIVATLCAAGGY